MATIILFAPLLGALIGGLGWRVIGEPAAQWITTGLLFLAAILSWVIFLTLGPETEHIQILRWIESGSLSTDWAIRLDRLTSIMLVVITTVSALVHLYSFGYMGHDENFGEGEGSEYKARFFAYLSFFTFAMLCLVTADNLVQMFFGWEGVGLASYLLIGFYYKKPSANAAAIKAFVVNRIGDFGFALGIFALYLLTDSIRFDDIFAATPELAQTSIRFLWTDWNAAESDRLPAVHRRDGKIGAVLSAHLAAGRDGGPDAGVGADPRRDDGDGGRVPGLPVLSANGIRALDANVYRHHRRDHGIFCCHRGAGAERHQTGDRLFDLFAAWLYVRGRGRRSLFGRDVPPADARILQGDAVPRGRFGHPRDAS